MRLRQLALACLAICALQAGAAEPSAAPVGDTSRVNLRTLAVFMGGKFGKDFVIDPRLNVTADLGGLSPDSISSIVEPSAIETSADPAEVITVAVPIGDLDVMQLMRTLRILIAPWGALMSSADEKSIVIVDTAANARRIVALVQQQTGRQQVSLGQENSR